MNELTEKMHHLVEYAIQKYPKQCTYICLKTGKRSWFGQVKSFAVHNELNVVVEIYTTGGCVYLNGKWAQRYKWIKMNPIKLESI